MVSCSLSVWSRISGRSKSAVLWFWWRRQWYRWSVFCHFARVLEIFVKNVACCWCSLLMCSRLVDKWTVKSWLIYNMTYIVPVLMYECETWATTRCLCARIDAIDTRALQDPEDPLQSPYNKCRSQGSVSRCPLLFNMVTWTTLEILGPQCSWWRPSPCSCCCNLQASIRLETTGRKIESDLRPLNIGPSCAWKKAASQEHWHSIVDTV